MQLKNVGKLIASVGICQLAGIIGSVFTAPEIAGWYQALQKPSFAPPGWAIGAVWIALFTLMGISLYLVWQRGVGNEGVKKGLIIFGIQLGLNIFWSYLFFGLHSPFFAFVEIIFLWFAILIAIYQFLKIDKTAAYLLIPYILWVSFATYLNFLIWKFNL